MHAYLAVFIATPTNTVNERDTASFARCRLSTLLQDPGAVLGRFIKLLCHQVTG